MTEPPGAPPTAADPQSLPYATPQHRRYSVLRLGGILGLAGVVVDLVLFLFGCMGSGAAFKGFPVVPLLLAIAGFILTIVGGIRRTPDDEDPHVLFGLFTNALALTAAILEIGIGKNWNLWR